MKSCTMGRKIVATGRWGAGKLSFTAPISRYLKSSILFVNFDPNLSVNDMLGFDFHKEIY